MTSREWSNTPIEGAMRRLAEASRRRVRILRYVVSGTPSVEMLRDFGAIIGEGVFIGNRCYFDERWATLIRIEDGAIFAPGVYVIAHDAGMWAETGRTAIAPVSIGERAYIGARSIIMPGVSVGREAVVGAGSVVTRDVAARTVVAGNPARPLRTVDELATHHQGQLSAAPRHGWTGPEVDDATTRAEILREVQVRGRAYVG